MYISGNSTSPTGTSNQVININLWIIIKVINNNTKKIYFLLKLFDYLEKDKYEKLFDQDYEENKSNYNR
jgi:hypothetical protein